MRLIDAEDVLRYLKFRRNRVFESPTSTLDAKFEIMEAVGYVENRTDTVNAAPVVHARWMWSPEYCKWICSACAGREGECETPICKWCGARIDLPEGEEAQDDG